GAWRRNASQARSLEGGHPSGGGVAGLRRSPPRGRGRGRSEDGSSRRSGGRRRTDHRARVAAAPEHSRRGASRGARIGFERAAMTLYGSSAEGRTWGHRVTRSAAPAGAGDRTEQLELVWRPACLAETIESDWS